MFTCGIKMHLRQLASQDTSPFTPIQGGRGCGVYLGHNNNRVLYEDVFACYNLVRDTSGCISVYTTKCKYKYRIMQDLAGKNVCFKPRGEEERTG